MKPKTNIVLRIIGLRKQAKRNSGISCGNNIIHHGHDVAGAVVESDSFCLGSLTIHCSQTTTWKII